MKTRRIAAAIVVSSISLLFLFSFPCRAHTFVWVGGDGHWSTPANWVTDPPSGIPGPPGELDTAVIPNGTAHVDGSGTYSTNIAALRLDADGRLIIEIGVGLDAADIHNDGIITVDWSGYYPSWLGFGDRSINISGSGTIDLINGGLLGLVSVPDPNNIKLINGPEHTIEGAGAIHMKVENYGQIIAKDFIETDYEYFDLS